MKRVLCTFLARAIYGVMAGMGKGNSVQECVPLGEWDVAHLINQYITRFLFLQRSTVCIVNHTMKNNKDAALHGKAPGGTKSSRNSRPVLVRCERSYLSASFIISHSNNCFIKTVVLIVGG